MLCQIFSLTLVLYFKTSKTINDMHNNFFYNVTPAPSDSLLHLSMSDISRPLRNATNGRQRGRHRGWVGHRQAMRWEDGKNAYGV